MAYLSRNERCFRTRLAKQSPQSLPSACDNCFDTDEVSGPQLPQDSKSTRHSSDPCELSYRQQLWRAACSHVPLLNSNNVQPAASFRHGDSCRTTQDRKQHSVIHFIHFIHSLFNDFFTDFSFTDFSFTGFSFTGFSFTGFSFTGFSFTGFFFTHSFFPHFRFTHSLFTHFSEASFHYSFSSRSSCCFEINSHVTQPHCRSSNPVNSIS